MEPLSSTVPENELVFGMSSPEKMEWMESPFGSEILSYEVMEAANMHMITLALPIVEMKADAFGENSKLLSIQLP